MSDDPRLMLRAWLPHLALLLVIGGSLWWLLIIIEPVRTALILAISLALLTYPVLFLPLDRFAQRLVPIMETETRRYFSAMAATVILVSLVLGIALTLLVALVGNLTGTLRLMVGLALKEEIRIQEIVTLVVERGTLLAQMFPSLHIDLGHLRTTVESLLANLSVGPAFVEYLVTGTGGFLAKSALTIVTLFYLYSQGPRLVKVLMDCLPLSEQQHQFIALRFHRTAVHLLMGTVARAATHGMVLGLLAWGLGGFNPILVGIGASFIALLPVAGPTVAWVPLASILWSQELIPQAIIFGLTAIISSIIIDRIALRLATILGTDDIWLSFLLFLAIVGGVIGFGPLGLIMGPAAVLTLSILVQVIPPLYGSGSESINGTSPDVSGHPKTPKKDA
jgi:predicted PurR-regulated permease PerM